MAMPNARAPLGLGLNLRPNIRAGFRDAAQAGTTAAWMAAHPIAGQKISTLAGGTGAPADRARAYMNPATVPPMGGRTIAAPPAPTPTLPNESNYGPPPAATTPTIAPPLATPPGKNGPTAPPPPAAPTFMDVLKSQFGEEQPFGPQSWYGGNPLETARDLANRNLTKSLGDIRARYAASGMGNSAREAIAEGTAAGESATGLGDVLASRGIGARNDDLTRALQGVLGAGGLDVQNRGVDIQQEQLPLSALSMLMNSGLALTDLQNTERMPPLLQMMLGMLTNFGNTSQTGTSTGVSTTGQTW